MVEYPFLNYINEDKSHYIHAKDFKYDVTDKTKNSLTVDESYWKTHEYNTYIDDDDLFLVGDSGGFLLNIDPGAKFVDVELFSEMANYYKVNKKYTNFKIDSIPHRRLRKREQYRRLHGFSAPCLKLADGTIKEIRITGSHYNFLNYNKIELLDLSSIKSGGKKTAKKTFDFPRFIDSQFWTFHVMEFAQRNGFHLLIDKTRRGGFSYMMASDSANAINNEHHKVVIHVAADSKYLTDRGGLTDFALNNINFYEQETPFTRGVVSVAKNDFRLGFRLSSGVESEQSWHSSLISVSANNNPNCAIGKDAIKVKVEEVSTMDNFDEFMSVTEPAMRTGAYTTGFLCAWGTATSGNMQVFEQNFYNPKAFNFMPFENVWDKDSRDQVCGYFKPYCWGLEGDLNGVKGVDDNGNCNIFVGLEIARRERIDKKNSSKSYGDYINYLGQYANFPAESFSSATENIFSSEELSAWEERLRIDNDLKFYVDGMLEMTTAMKVVFKSNSRLVAEGKKVYDYIFGVPRRGNEDPHGCIRKWFDPEFTLITDGNGREIREIPAGLYSITYDPVGVNKEKNEITNKHSHNSIKVWMNPHISNGFKQKLVASYYGRPDKLEEADYICYLLAVYYNCVGTTIVEVNRGETVSNFKKWRALKYLACEPLFVWDNSFKGQVNTNYGYNINTSNKLEAIRLFKEFLYEEIGKDENGNPIRNFHRILDYQTIIELKKWNSKGNFDRVSEGLLRGIEWKAQKLKSEEELSNRKYLKEEDSESNDILEREWF